MSFTTADVVAKVRDLAVARPHFIYTPPETSEPVRPACLYVHYASDGTLVGGCIVGQALLSLGVPAETLRKYDESDGANASTVVSELLDVGACQELLWLDDVQRKQDNGYEWVGAVHCADAAYSLDN